MGTFGTGVRHLRAEWGRWWRADDLTDTHVAHRILNDQYRRWARIRQRTQAEIQQSIGLLKKQQQQSVYMQQQRIAMMRQQRVRGGGYGFGFSMGMGGASPFAAYRVMQWSQLKIKIGMEEFQHTEITDGMLAIGRGQIRARRHWTMMGVLPALVALWLLIWWASALAGLALTAATLLVFAVAAWVKGRNPTWRRPPVPKLLFVPPKAPAHTELEEPQPVPFPLREAGRDPRRVRECVRLALVKDGVQLREMDGVDVPEETDYGWTVPLGLSSGTLADVVRVLKKVATTLRVGANRLTAAATDPTDSSAITLRILTSDPFTGVPPSPYRAPGSVSIRNECSLGGAIDGESTPVMLAGQHVIIVADTGGGKSAMMQHLADFVTACRDAVAVDIDPSVKRGLRSFSQCAARVARGPDEAEKRLEELLALCGQRIQSMPPTQRMWEPTPEDPAVLAFLDEYPELSPYGKELAIRLLRLGREALITLVISTQDATKEVMGDAIASVPGVRILMPCRPADVPITVGPQDAVSQGWLPHLLVPSPDPDHPEDAGKFYAITPKHRSPILRYVAQLDPIEADRRARERVAAGLPTLAAPATVPADAPEIAKILFKIFATEGDPDALTTGQLADHLVNIDPAKWGRWEGRKDRVSVIGRQLTRELKAADIALSTVRLDHLPGRPSGYRHADLIEALS